MINLEGFVTWSKLNVLVDNPSCPQWCSLTTLLCAASDEECWKALKQEMAGPWPVK